MSNLQTYKSPTELVAASEKIAKSNLIPSAFQNKPENVYIALELAERLKMPSLMIMQSIHVIEGNPTWKSQYVIACVNASGRFAPLSYERTEDPHEKEIEYNEWVWNDALKKNTPVTKKTKIKNVTVRAYAKDRQTGEVIYGIPVSIEMAIKEGWYYRKGSKWQSMPELMLQYRAASFFGKIHVPEYLNGMLTAEEYGDTAPEKEISGTAAPVSVPVTRAEEIKSILTEIVAEHAEPEPEFTIENYERDIKNAATVDDLEQAAGKYRGHFKGDTAKRAKQLYTEREAEING